MSPPVFSLDSFICSSSASGQRERERERESKSKAAGQLKCTFPSFFPRRPMSRPMPCPPLGQGCSPNPVLREPSGPKIASPAPSRESARGPSEKSKENFLHSASRQFSQVLVSDFGGIARPKSASGAVRRANNKCSLHSSSAVREKERTLTKRPTREVLTAPTRSSRSCAKTLKTKTICSRPDSSRGTF